jgi:polyhydroxybutyrate depolymerase
VVVLLHGNDGYSDPISEITDPKGGFDTFGEQQGFIAIYPKSIGSWNHGSAPSPNRDDDVSFIIEVVKIVARQRNIDGRRVFIAGFSTGGMMAQHVVCDTPGGFAGLAVVAASLSRSLAENCKNGNSVPAVFVFGTSDPMIDFGGGPTWPGGTQYAPQRSVGNVARDFSANQAIWDFFWRAKVSFLVDQGSVRVILETRTGVYGRLAAK